LSKIVFGLCAFLILLLTGIIFYWHFNPVAFSRVAMIAPFDAGFGMGNIELIDSAETTGDAVVLSDLSAAMMYWVYIRSVFFLGITLFMAWKIIAVLQSIEKLETFYTDNIQHFKVLAKLGFIAFAVSCANFGYVNGELKLSLTLALGPLLFSVACLILSEVFREGKALLEENNMIV
jgi:hypothetical protein